MKKKISIFSSFFLLAHCAECGLTPHHQQKSYQKKVLCPLSGPLNLWSVTTCGVTSSSLQGFVFSWPWEATVYLGEASVTDGPPCDGFYVFALINSFLAFIFSFNRPKIKNIEERELGFYSITYLDSSVSSERAGDWGVLIRHPLYRLSPDLGCVWGRDDE